MVVSAVQQFAAGVVFAAAAGEILPGLKHSGATGPVLLGGALGVFVMLWVKELEGRAKGPVGLMTAVGVDMLIDGLVLGLGFIAGAKEGLVLTIALTLEVLFLGVAVATELAGENTSKRRVVAITAGLVLLTPVGALLAIPIAVLPASLLTGFFAFGLVALLYLVTEELLVEAHEVPDRPWITAMFFGGFLILLMLEETLG